MKGKAMPEELSFLQEMTMESYSDTPKSINGWEIAKSTPNTKFWVKGNNVIVGVRGTKSGEDVSVWPTVPLNTINTTNLYKRNKEAILQFQNEHPGTYYAVGHSLGGAIIDSLLRDGLIKEAVSYNPAIQYKDINGGLKNKRIYYGSDPLYKLMGWWDKTSEHRKPTDRSWIAFLGNFSLPAAGLSALASHGLSKFVGGNKVDDLKLKIKETIEYLRRPEFDFKIAHDLFIYIMTNPLVNVDLIHEHFEEYKAKHFRGSKIMDNRFEEMIKHLSTNLPTTGYETHFMRLLMEFALNQFPDDPTLLGSGTMTEDLLREAQKIMKQRLNRSVLFHKTRTGIEMQELDSKPLLAEDKKVIEDIMTLGLTHLQKIKNEKGFFSSGTRIEELRGRKATYIKNVLDELLAYVNLNRDQMYFGLKFGDFPAPDIPGRSPEIPMFPTTDIPGRSPEIPMFPNTRPVEPEERSVFNPMHAVRVRGRPIALQELIVEGSTRTPDFPSQSPKQYDFKKTFTAINNHKLPMEPIYDVTIDNILDDRIKFIDIILSLMEPNDPNAMQKMKSLIKRRIVLPLHPDKVGNTPANVKRFQDTMAKINIAFGQNMTGTARPRKNRKKVVFT